ncbi:hypothetical protein I4U23_007577 [Adineta vaga]|nr:hypothetical protein I4U23_007577 [Adineta vaga]
MKTILIICMTFFALVCASSPSTTIKPPSIIDSLSHLLYIHLNPTFQNTLQELIQLFFEFGDRLFRTIEYRSTRSNPVAPAPWVSQLFGEVNGIATQWNNHVTQFFTNIPTIFEKNSRSLFNFSSIKQALYDAVAIVLHELKQLFVNNVNGVMISIINKYDLQHMMGRKREEMNFDILFNVFQQQVSGVFEKMKEQLDQNIDNAINFFVTYWNGLKDLIIAKQ